MVGDLVGFHNNGGYLGSTVQSWVTFFPFMSVVDAFLYARNSFTPSQLALPWATTDAAAFIVAAGNYYRSLNPNFPSYNVSDVLSCILAWQQTQQELGNVSEQLQGPTNPQYYRYCCVRLCVIER